MPFTRTYRDIAVLWIAVVTRDVIVATPRPTPTALRA